ncbi:MAG: sugar phosphate isomerase/epimerase, partial [Acidobacteria bacterium]|nr:sugar phosphate isomerase/epimerase [Acidobacteriota bacterium]
MHCAFNRRRFITAAGAFLSLKGANAFSALNSVHSSDIKLGVASYSLRKLSRAQAIAAVKELKTPYLNIKEFHLL